MPDPSPSRRPAVRHVVEAVRPHPGAFDARTMARGEPGVPARFDWRGTTYVVVEVLGRERESSSESGAPKDTYLRRHVVRVRLASGEIATLSAARRGPRGAPRWILRAIEPTA